MNIDKESIIELVIFCIVIWIIGIIGSLFFYFLCLGLQALGI